MNKDKVLFSISPNYYFSGLASITYGCAIYVLTGWILKLDYWISGLIIFAIIFLFLNFSLYKTTLSKGQVAKTYILRPFLRIELNKGVVEKVFYKASGAGTNYLHVHLRSGRTLLKKTIMVSPFIGSKTLASISVILLKNEIQVDGFS
ncbi:MAG: hypothetical protein AAGF85_04350 [Bacteroidota bacterium]